MFWNVNKNKIFENVLNKFAPLENIGKSFCMAEMKELKAERSFNLFI